MDRLTVVCFLMANVCLRDLFAASEIHVNIHDEAGHKHLYNIRLARDKTSEGADNLGFANKLASNYNVDHGAKGRSESALVDKMKLSSGAEEAPSWTPSTEYLVSKLRLRAGLEGFLPLEVSEECLSENRAPNLPAGLCSDERSPAASAVVIQERGKLLAKRRRHLGEGLAMAVVLMNSGRVQQSLEQLDQLIANDPADLRLYAARATALLRPSPQRNLRLALESMDKAVALNTSRSESYNQRAGLLFLSGRPQEAIRDLNSSLTLARAWRTLYQRGLFRFVLERLSAAEEDFRAALKMRPQEPQMLHQLGLTLFYRGRLHPAIQVLREAIDIGGEELDLVLSLALAYSKIGAYERAMEAFGKCLSLRPSPPQLAAIHQSQASLHFNSGAPDRALDSAAACLEADPQHPVCLYLHSLALTSLGQFYDGIKAATRLMVLQNDTSVRVAPEFVKVHYLREWARFLHHRLDRSVHAMNLSDELSGEFRDKWVKGVPIEFVRNYQEQPGLQPHIADLTPRQHLRFERFPPPVRRLLCRAQRVGRAFRVTSDGFLNNERTHFALGLAAVHTGQLLDDFWDSLVSSGGGREPARSALLQKVSWSYVAELTARYAQLANPEAPVMWLHQMPTDYLREGYTLEKNFVRGAVENVRLMPYFRLVFHLVRTMVEYMQGDKQRPAVSKELLQEIKSARDCEQLLRAAKKKGTFTQSGIMVSTQVPSLKYKDAYQHDGDMILLTEDQEQRPVLSLNILTNADRIHTYREELNFLFSKLTDDVVRARQGTGRSDSLVDAALSLLYYMCNANLLSQNTGFISYSATLGTLMALGYEVHGFIPPGKLLDIEPLLAGTPDAFFLVTKQWLKHEKNADVLSSLPNVDAAFPTVRSLLEAFFVGPRAKCDQND